MKDEWGPWTSGWRHPGDGVVIMADLHDQETRKKVRRAIGMVRNGFFCENLGEFEADKIDWSLYVHRYRVRKPRGMTILEEALDVTEDQFRKAVEPV